MALTNIGVVEGADARLASCLRETGLEISGTMGIDQLGALERSPRVPDVLVIDLADRPGVPAEIGALKRRHPRLGVVIVAAALDPAMMLEAMRAGVTEFVTEPLQPTELRAAVERIVGHQVENAAPGKVIAFLGAKGGVGSTTLAVNVAAALASRQTLLVDLHVNGHGDAALLLGVEPRFSVADALENAGRLDASYLRSLVVRSKDGVDLLASPERPSLKQPDGGHVREVLQRLAELYPYIILDVPRSDFGIVDALDTLTNITLVVNQELPTVRRAAQVGALLRQRYGKDRVGAVVTRYDVRADIGQEDIERVVNLPVWATLPSDYRKVLSAANAGRPLVSDNHSRLSGAIVQLAERLAGPAALAATVTPKAGKSRGRLGLF